MAKLTPAEEDAILARSGIEIVLGGRPHRVAPLTIEDTRHWKQHLASRVGIAWVAIAAGADDWAKVIATVAAMTDQHVQLLVAWDEAHDADGKATRPGSLGGIRTSSSTPASARCGTGSRRCSMRLSLRSASSCERCRRPSCCQPCCNSWGALRARPLQLVRLPRPPRARGLAHAAAVRPPDPEAPQAPGARSRG